MDRVRRKEEKYDRYKHLIPRLEEGISYIERGVLHAPYEEIKTSSLKRKAMLRLEYKFNRAKLEHYSTFLIQLLRLTNLKNSSELTKKL